MEAQTRQDVLRRLKSVEGHVRGVIQMVEGDQPCMTILHQVQAVQGALKQINLLLLSSHLDHCLGHVLDDRSDPVRHEMRNELLTLFDIRSSELRE